MKTWLHFFLIVWAFGLLPSGFAESETLTDKEREELDKTVGKDRAEQFLKGYHKAFSASINFWGKVVDEKGQAIADAKVKLSPTTSLDNWGDLPKSEFTTFSDQNGVFSLIGKKGASLFVAVSKDGYYQSDESAKTFSYGSANDWVPVGLPTQEKPAIFVLRKKGESAILVELRNLRYPMTNDGSPMEINLETGVATDVGKGDLKLEFWSDAPSQEEERQILLKGGHTPNYSWRVRITLHGGGIVTRNGKFSFEAPTEGYQGTMEIGISKDAEKWRNGGERQVFFKTRNGKYGRMELRLHARPGGNTIYMDGFYNPMDSRNLESHPKKIIDSKKVAKLGLVKALEEFQKKTP